MDAELYLYLFIGFYFAQGWGMDLKTSYLFNQNLEN